MSPFWYTLSAIIASQREKGDGKMLYYRIEATIDEEKINDCGPKYAKRERTGQIAGFSNAFNQKHTGCYCFVSDFRCSDIVAGVLADHIVDIEQLARSFLAALGLDIQDLRCDEITLLSMRGLLHSAERDNTIDSRDAVIKMFDLEPIDTRAISNLSLQENLLEPNAQKQALYAVSDKYMVGLTLTPELDRIYCKSALKSAYGHPVHYIVSANGSETQSVLSQTLLQTLYVNGRLKSRRYSSIEFSAGQRSFEDAFNALYKSSIGGSIIVRYTDDDCEIVDERTIRYLCKTMMKYRNQVLTIFCLPGGCEEIMECFRSNLGSAAIVVIEEDVCDKERSSAFLKKQCRIHGIRPDKDLCSNLESDRTYRASELLESFDGWYAAKMKNKVYPQYRKIETCVQRTHEADSDGTKNEAYEKLCAMVGLKEAKAVIDKALNYQRLARIYQEQGLNQDKPSMHMVFTGNPGTAKTTVARLTAQIMKDKGVLSSGHIVEVGRGDLVGRYVGWTASIVKEKFKKAKGGVLFIDEAYSLVDYHQGLYGDEAINTIVQEMENNRENLIVILAGYPREMDDLLSRNPGLRSRIAFHVPFADYTAAELCEIARLIAKEKDAALTDGALRKLSAVFEKARTDPGFGNGRYVRNIIEHSKMNLAGRVLKMNPSEITKEALQIIEECDIEVPPEQQKEMSSKRQIGF